MKFLIALLVTALLGYAGGLYFPWWIIACTSFIVAVCIPQKPWKAFLSGFAGLFFLWGIQSFYIDAMNGHLLAQKVSAILFLGGSAMALILVTAVVGGLVGGMAALTASFVRKPI